MNIKHVIATLGLAVCTCGGVAAHAAVLMDQSFTVDPQTYAAQRFSMVLTGNVTVTFASGLVGFIFDSDACDEFLNDPSRNPPPKLTSNTGSMIGLLAPGEYCVVIENDGSSTIQTELRVEGTADE